MKVTVLAMVKGSEHVVTLHGDTIHESDRRNMRNSLRALREIGAIEGRLTKIDEYTYSRVLNSYCWVVY